MTPRPAEAARLNVDSRTLALEEIAALPIMQNLPAGVHEAKQGDSEALAELFGGFMVAIVAGIGLTFSVLVLLFRGSSNR